MISAKQPTRESSSAIKNPTLNIVVLAAGQGKRMKSALPKVLHALAGKPMLAHVLETANQLAPDKICIVYGHGGEAVRAAFADMPLLWAKQDPQLGTGHAVLQAMPLLAQQRSGKFYEAWGLLSAAWPSGTSGCNTRARMDDSRM